MNYLTIHDIGNQDYEQCLVYRWLKAANLEPPSPDTINVDEFQVSESFDLKSFGHLFHMTLNRLMVDMCPWFSIFLARHYSHLSKSVDANLLLFMFFLNNLLNILLIDTTPNGNQSGHVQLGTDWNGFKITWQGEV